MGGEKRLTAHLEHISYGSPPRWRGKGTAGLSHRQGVGITPAWAGKKHVEPGQLLPERGSPPRGRGKGRAGPCPCDHCRITPAQAGKSRPFSDRQRRTGDHPRAGGEKFALRNMMNVNQGSPPRGRGKGCCHHCVILVDGITPAQAGKSRAAEPGGCLH